MGNGKYTRRHLLKYNTMIASYEITTIIDYHEINTGVFTVASSACGGKPPNNGGRRPELFTRYTDYTQALNGMWNL